MTVDAAILGDVAPLATALGLLDAAGQVDPAWFRDPGSRVSSMLRNPTQRAALVAFVEAARADATAPVTDDPGRTWVPLINLTNRSELFLVLEPNARGVVVSLGLRGQTTSPARASVALRIPLVRVRETAGVDFLVGSTSSGDIADATARVRAEVDVADATLGSVGIDATVPLTPGLGTPAVAITIHGLRLPGSPEALDIVLDGASPLGPELAHLLAAVLQAEAPTVTGAARDVLGLLGLLATGSAVPPLPVAAVLAGGVPALLPWLESVAGTPAALQAWLAHLAAIVGATPGSAGISLALASGVMSLSVGVSRDATGGMVIVPALSVSHVTPGSPELRLSAEAELVAIRLGVHAGVRALPSLSLSARYGGDAGTIVNVPGPPAAVSVGALRAGVTLDADRKPTLRLAAERVAIGADGAHLHHHDVLDLTSPDALAEVAGAGLDTVLSGILGGLGTAGAALEVLVGLSPPPGAPSGWPALSVPAFFGDPLGAVAAFYRDVLAFGAGAFGDLLGVVPGLLGATAAAITGSGTPAAPWSLELAPGVVLVVWHDGTPAVLHAGVRAGPAIPALGGPAGPTLGLAFTAEVLALTLPPAGAAGTPYAVSVRALPELAVETSLSGPGGQPFSFGAGYAISLQTARLKLAWSPTSGLAASFDLPGATVTVAGVATPLGPIAIGPGGRFSLPLDLPWVLVEHALASALVASALPWVQGLPDLLGLGTPTFAQAGGLPALVTNPLGLLKSLLAALLASADGERILARLAASLAALTHGPAGAGLLGGPVNGSGTPADPFAVQIGGGPAELEATLWLEPDGPPVDLSAQGTILAPEALGRWLDGDPGAQTLDLATVAAMLAQASHVPAIGGLLAGRDTLAAGLAALATRITGGDGLLRVGAADVPGATASTLAGATHGQLSARIDLAAVLGAAPDPAVTVYVTGPFAPPWPGLASRTFDLTGAGLGATAFDVARAGGEDGPWHVRLPARAACPGGDGDSQLVAQAARLARVVEGVQSRHPGRVVLVAHGSTGQAARLVASTTPGVARLVLLGVPAAGLSLDVLDVPPAADALQLLVRILPPPDPGQPDEADLAAGRAILAVLAEAYASPLAPAGDFLAPRAPGALTPPTWSVHGTLDGPAVNRALAAVVRAGLAAASPGASTPRRTPTGLRGGLRMSLAAAPAAAGPGADGVAVVVDVDLDCGLVAIDGVAPRPPALSMAVTLSRPGGWLAGGPFGLPAPLDLSRTPSLRRARLELAADLAGTAALRARIVLDEVDALTLRRDQLVLDGSGPVTPEARVLLGRLASALGSAPAGSRLAGVVALLRAVGLTDPAVAAPAVGLSVDAITRLFIDPTGQLRGALATAAARAEATVALRALTGQTPATGSTASLSRGGLDLALDLTAPTAALRLVAAGLELPGGLTLTVDAAIDAHGASSGSAALSLSGPPGPSGRPSLRLSGGPTIELRVDGGLGGLPSVLSLWPLPAAGSVAGILPVAVSLFAGQLLRDLLGALRDLDAVRLDPVLAAVGLLSGAGAGARIRLPAGLIADPGGWLSRSLGTSSGLDADRVSSLLDAVRALAGLPGAPHGTLPLALGITASAAAAPGGGLRLGLDLAQRLGALDVAADAGLTLRPGAAALPHLSLDVAAHGHAGTLRTTLDGPALSVGLVLGSGSTVAIYPSGPGLGGLAAAGVTAALPLVLDQLEAGGPAAVRTALTAARTVLGLGAPHFSSDQLRLVAGDPAGELERRLAARGPAALAGLLPLVSPALPAGWTTDTSDPHALTVASGAHHLTLRYTQVPARLSVEAHVVLDRNVGSTGLTGSVDLKLDGTGLRRLDVTAGIDPHRAVNVGPAAFAPFVRILGGLDAAGRVEAGIAVVSGPHTRALAATITLGPPIHVALGTRTDAADDASPDPSAILSGFVIPLVADVALANATVASLLAHSVLPGAKLRDLLEGVLLTTGHFDPGVLETDPAHALKRLLRLAGNVAAGNPSVVVVDHLRVGVAHGPTAGDIGLGITVDPGQRVALTTGDLTLSIEVDATWTSVLGAASPGISVVLVRSSAGEYALTPTPAAVIDGVGLRISRSSGPLLDSGLRIGSLALYGVLAIDNTGVTAAGGKLELADLGVAVAAASGGSNSVAQGVLGQAAAGHGDNTPLRPQFSPSLAIERRRGSPLEWALRAGDGSGPWWLVVQRSFGPLHIEQVGFGVDQSGGTIHGVRVLFDGGLSMLGLSIEVEELSIGARWPAAATDPPLTDPHAWSIDLAGLAIGYEGGGISLAGALRRRGSPPDYEGVLIARLGPYGLTAFGGYGQFLAPDGSRFTSLFVLAGITAPIGGPPAFFVTGLGGGAGINRQLVLPASLDDLPNYPLVAAIDPHSTLASDPQHALDELSAAFPPERGTFWFAAGVSFTSFAIVDVTAVIAVSVGDGLQVALLGVGRMGLPTPYAPIVQVELALQARFSTKEGALVVQAQLTHNSWLLTPDCRLTGGFAFASFFGSNPNAGQFVLSIGGYHPSFHHDGYPDVPRVGYVWSVASVLTISGQSYFALTSEAIMAGTSFTAALELGFLWASLTMGVDAIVYFDPFKFVADGYAAIAAGVTVDIDFGWFGHIRVSFSFHLGATVHIEGPDFRGSAHIDLDVTSATIAFGGDRDQSTHLLAWSDFSAKYLTAGGADVLSAMPRQGQLQGTATTAAGTTPNGDADKPWKFAAEWSLSVATTAAATKLALPGGVSLDYPATGVVGIASMAVATLTSTLSVTVTGPEGPAPILPAGDAREGLHVALLTAPLPKGVWAANPDDATVPAGDTITAGTGFTLLATAAVEGATAEIPVNQIDPPKARKPLPFAPEAAARPARQSDQVHATAFASAAPTTAPQALAAAAAYLASGPQGTGLGPLALATFGRDRLAPPRLALLTEGMVAPASAPPVLTAVVAVPPVAIDTSVHRPVLVALLDGGAVPSQRPARRTTATAAGARTAAASTALIKVRAPTLAGVSALIDPAFAASLTRIAPTALPAGTGLRSADGGPVSLRAATPGELRRGPVLAGEDRARLTGSLRDLLGQGLTLRPGDLALAELPNAGRDLDGSATRPTLSVRGDAAVRVVALTATGGVLLDTTGVEMTGLTVPQHAARVALWCVGGDGSRAAGLSGWHDAARLPQVGGRTLLGADCVVTGAAHARRGPAAVSAANVRADRALGGPGLVVTRLAPDTQVVVLCLDPTGDDRDVSGLTLGISGASRKTDAAGEPVAPLLVNSGARLYLLYALVAQSGGDELLVTVSSDERWDIAGVLGGPGEASTTAAALATSGLGIAAPLLHAPTGSAQVSWNAPERNVV